MFVVVALVAPVVQAAASKAANCVYCYSAVTFSLLLLLLSVRVWSLLLPLLLLLLLLLLLFLRLFPFIVLSVAIPVSVVANSVIDAVVVLLVVAGVLSLLMVLRFLPD